MVVQARFQEMLTLYRVLALGVMFTTLGIKLQHDWDILPERAEVIGMLFVEVIGILF